MFRGFVQQPCSEQRYGWPNGGVAARDQQEWAVRLFDVVANGHQTSCADEWFDDVEPAECYTLAFEGCVHDDRIVV